MHVREALEEAAGSGFGLFQLAGLDEVDCGVGGGGELFELFVDLVGLDEPLQEGSPRLALLQAAGRRALLTRGLLLDDDLGLLCLLVGQAALLVFLTAAAGPVT